MGTTTADFGRRAMASPWRQRRLCTLAGESRSPAAIRSISAGGAILETNARPALGAPVSLHHPEAGAIAGWVDSVGGDGVTLRFERGEGSVAFALAAITADMTRPA